jgi:hypothetical protein
MWPKDRLVHEKTAKAKGCGSYLLSCLAVPGAEVVTLTERWKSPSAVVDNCIMNVALIAVLRGNVGACRSYAVGVLRVHVVQKIKASSLRLTCADHRADSDDCGESEESDARGFHVRHSCPYGCTMQLIERGYLQRTKLYVIEVTFEVARRRALPRLSTPAIGSGSAAPGAGPIRSLTYVNGPIWIFGLAPFES